MTHPTWPLYDLVVRTPLLELRLPHEDELVELVRQADHRIYDNTGFMPFNYNWTGKPIDSMRHFWRTWADFSPNNWTLGLVPFIDGEPLGSQSLRTTDFPIVRRFNTGSYLLPQAQGRGLGTEMRAAALHLAFEGLGALEAESEAHVDNVASNGVSRRLGYEITHRRSSRFGDTQGDIYHLLLRRETWQKQRRDDIEIIGLEGACLDMFGLGDDTGPAEVV